MVVELDSPPPGPEYLSGSPGHCEPACRELYIVSRLCMQTGEIVFIMGGQSKSVMDSTVSASILYY